MTRDEIIKMASMAGFETKNGMVWVDQWEVTRTMERFAALVAAAEREACAKVCDEQVVSKCLAPLEIYRTEFIAAAIRAREEK